MQRFYLQSPKINRNLVEITDKRICHQTSKVLRMWKDDEFRIFDEKGSEHLVKIIEISQKKVLAQVIGPIENNTEPSVNVSLYQAIPKKPALFELVIQKATEIGASAIYPLITERTEKRRLGKFDRMLAIAMEATEQCGRSKVPVIHHPINFDEVISKSKNAYIGYEYEGKKFLSDYGDELYKGGEVQIIIGPEGGFSQQEIELAEKSDAKPFTLGPRILRTETAAIASLSLVLLNENV
ncbi:16S rRNA (uracil(1498)-N(3))-methyltransferase [Candidatus Peregrinibacteria bacterium]|nr:16S rRNA (uracil(1498)-N(3))-methyltransferase [Candidatus Peregrinibacteria bacterium]